MGDVLHRQPHTQLGEIAGGGGAGGGKKTLGEERARQPRLPRQIFHFPVNARTLMHGVDRFRQPGIAQDLHPAGGVTAPAGHPAADNQRGHHVRQSGEDPGIARLAGERFPLHRRQQRLDLRPGVEQAAHPHHFGHGLHQRLHAAEFKVHTTAENHGALRAVRLAASVDTTDRAAHRFAVQLRHIHHRGLRIGEQGVPVAVGNKQRVAALQGELFPAGHAQQHRPAADEMELGFARHGAKADAKRAGGLDAPVIHAGEAHTAQQFAGQVDSGLAHGNSGRIINN